MSEAATAPQIGDDLGDDIVLPFRTDRSGVIGRLVRLGRHRAVLDHDDAGAAAARVDAEDPAGQVEGVRHGPILPLLSWPDADVVGIAYSS